MKVLVFSIRAGMGHIKGGEAICEGINSLNRDGSKHFILLEGTRLGWFINASYLWMARHSPWLYGLLYKKKAFYKHTYYIDYRIKEQAQRIIRDERPDCVCCLHPFITKAISEIKKRDFPLVSIATDFESHPLCIKDNVDMFIAPHKSSLEHLIKNGIDPLRIKVIGIPILAKFSRKAKVKKEDFGLNSKPIVLEIGGGYGLGHIERFIPPLAEDRELFQMVVIAGKDGKLKKRLENALKRHKIEGRVFGFIDNVDEIMEISDVMIGKPGGLVVMEACSKGLPMVITDAIDGQEEANAKVLVEEGIAIMPKYNEIPFVLKELLKEKEKREKMKEHALKFSRPYASLEIAKEIINLVGERNG